MLNRRLVQRAADSHVTSERKVLVHCSAGVSRSATVLVAWAMKRRRMSLLASVAHVRKVRRIYPIEALFTWLIALDNTLADKDSEEERVPASAAEMCL